MLQQATVESSTLELLKELMQDEELKKFVLVGGTALALQIGHRKSIDLDFFSEKDFDTKALLVHLKNTRNFEDFFERKNTLKGAINGVKIDIITHAYPMVSSFVIEEGIRMASLADIAGMKLNAVIGNGARVKDFVDIATLSSIFSLEQMLEVYAKKYNSSNVVMGMKAITYFADIDFNEEIVLMKGKFKWKPFADRLDRMVKHPNKIFEQIK